MERSRLLKAVETISAEVPDWTREAAHHFWEPGRKLLKSIRGYQAARNPITRKLCILRHRFWSVITGADIPLNCQIGGGLLIPHPNGIVIHPDAQIGVNCCIFQQVTIGTRRGGGVPTIGGGVDIGAGAKVFGAVTVAPHTFIRANAIVTNPNQRTHDA